ncbi:MAG: septum formation initiator family protein [Alphaproteobacteria bacterium]|nr:septum formation initiator family protein [Alphaproteobacteria bacterium]
MEIWSYLINKSKSSAVIICLMLLCAYFSYFAVRGDRGLFKYLYLQEKVAEAQKLNNNYDRKKNELEQKVKLLSSNSLDLDLLDERARAVLNVIGDDEFIIIDDDNESEEELD